MSVVAVPETTFDIVAAPSRVENAPQKVLFVGQKTSTGSAAAGALTANVGVNGEQDELFGSDSMLAASIRAFRRINPLTRIDVIALDDDGAGAAASATITVSGPSLVAGSITISVQSTALHTVTVSVSPSDTADDIAAAINAALSSLTNVMFTTSVLANVVTLTCAHKGTVGNDLLLKVSENIPGVSLALTKFSGGSGDPVLTNVFDVVGEVRYQTIVFPSNYATTQLKTFLDSRFNVQGDVLDGVALMSDPQISVATADTKYNSLVTYAAVLTEKLSDTDQFKGSLFEEFSYTTAGKFAAERTKRLTPGADVSDIIAGATANATTTGGASFANVPYANTPIPDSTIIDSSRWWTKDEQRALRNIGLSVAGNNRSETEVVLGEIVTLQGKVNANFKFLNALDAASAAREYFYENNLQQYAQVKLTQGDKISGAPMVNAEDIRLFQISLYKDLANLAITPKGTVFEDIFKKSLLVSIDFTTGTVTIDASLPLVSAVRQIQSRLNITFSTN